MTTILSQYLLIYIQLYKHQNIVWNVVKVTN